LCIIYFPGISALSILDTAPNVEVEEYATNVEVVAEESKEEDVAFNGSDTAVAEEKVESFVEPTDGLKTEESTEDVSKKCVFAEILDILNPFWPLEVESPSPRKSMVCEEQESADESTTSL
jgi:hypothetical protein